MFIHEPAVLLLFIILVLNASIFSYQSTSRPFKTRFDNRLELLNESFIVVISIHLIGFTDWLDVNQQEWMGWSMDILILIVTLINLMIIFYQIYLYIAVYFKKYKIRLDKKYNDPFGRLYDKILGKKKEVL